MKPKKYPKADIDRNIGLYFLIGLNLALFTTWRLLEMKTYEKPQQFAEIVQVVEDFSEDVPQTEQVKVEAPPPPPNAPDVIEIVDDVADIEETIIETTESSQETYIEDVVVRVDDVAVEEVEEEISVPFAVIEKAPIFPGCEGMETEEEKRECFNQKVQEHIHDNLVYPAVALELGIKGRVFVTFEVGADGKVANIRQRGPDRILEEEAVRIIASLPEMTPGKQRGKNVKVGYSVPINFVFKAQ
ncbi:hypothetical protein FGF1_20280 [Flavobacteriaceae bacterium GF1]